MGATTLALKLSDELGVTAAKANRLIDDLGATRATRLVDDGGQFVDNSKRLPSDWWKPVAATGTIGGALGTGALIWRQQDVEKARHVAQQGQTYQDTLRLIAETDLPPELKKRLFDGATDAATGGSSSGDGGGGDGPGGLIPDDPATLIVLVIVMALVLKFALEGDD